MERQDHHYEMKAPLSISIVIGMTFSFIAPLMGQLEIDEPLLLSSPNVSDRQVSGLGYPEDVKNAVNAGTLTNGSVQYNEANGVDQITLLLDPPLNNYTAGLLVTFKPSAANTGAVVMDVDGLGPIPLYKNLDQELDSADLRPSSPVTVIFNGTDFLLLSQYSNACPLGSIDMTKEYCIDAQPSAPANFWIAIKTCAEKNARLCSIGEWHYACRKAQDFTSSVNGYEWVDHAANDSDKAKRVGKDINGITDCYDGGHSVPSSSQYFRCCYTK